MGVPKPKTAGSKKKPARAPQQLTAEEHYENAEMAFAMESFDRARTSFKRALDLEPENVEFLEGYGSFLAEVGPHAEALAVLQKAAQLAPNEGFEKYMYLGQLLEGPEAEQSVRKGIAILRGHIKRQAEEPPAPEGSDAAAQLDELRQHMDGMLASALCSLVEVLMNQAQEAGEEGLAGVQGECEQLLSESRALAPASPEPLQALASLRQQQGRTEEALGALRQSLALWFKPPPPMGSDSDGDGEEGEGAAQAGAAPAAAAQPAGGGGAPAAGAQPGGGEAGSEGGSSGSDDDEMDVEGLQLGDDPNDGLPSYEFRFEAAKLLLELDDSVATASQVLEQLLEENDSDPNVWLLLALCCQAGGDLEGALSAAEEGIALCKKLQLPPDDEALAGFEAMHAELADMLAAEAKARRAAEAGK